MTMKSEKIMWVHPYLAIDEQWDSREPKLKEKSCNVVSVLPDDDNIIVASLNDSKDEKHASATQDGAPQPTGTQSGKSYLRQYEKTTDETSREILVLASCTRKGKPKRSLI